MDSYAWSCVDTLAEAAGIANGSYAPGSAPCKQASCRNIAAISPQYRRNIAPTEPPLISAVSHLLVTHALPYRARAPKIGKRRIADLHFPPLTSPPFAPTRRAALRST